MRHYKVNLVLLCATYNKTYVVNYSLVQFCIIIYNSIGNLLALPHSVQEPSYTE